MTEVRCRPAFSRVESVERKDSASVGTPRFGVVTLYGGFCRVCCRWNNSLFRSVHKEFVVRFIKDLSRWWVALLCCYRAIVAIVS